MELIRLVPKTLGQLPNNLSDRLNANLICHLFRLAFYLSVLSSGVAPRKRIVRLGERVVNGLAYSASAPSLIASEAGETTPHRCEPLVSPMS